MIVPSRMSFGFINARNTVAALPAKEQIAFHYPHPTALARTVAVR